MEIYETVGFLAIFLLCASLIQLITQNVSGKINRSIEESMEKLFQSGSKSASIVDREYENFKCIKDKKRDLTNITQIIGVFEIITFSVYSNFVVSMSESTLIDNIQTIAVAVAGWMAIKVLGNYSQWTGSVYGRATFYSFLIASGVNILLAIILGVGTSFLIF